MGFRIFPKKKNKKQRMETTQVIKFDTSHEVTRQQYELIHKHFDGLVAFRHENNEKFFIKVMIKSAVKHIQNIVNNYA